MTEVRAEDDDIGVNTHSLYEIIEECQLNNGQSDPMTHCSRPRYFIFKETALAEKGRFNKTISFDLTFFFDIQEQLFYLNL